MTPKYPGQDDMRLLALCTLLPVGVLVALVIVERREQQLAEDWRAAYPEPPAGCVYAIPPGNILQADQWSPWSCPEVNMLRDLASDTTLPAVHEVVIFPFGPYSLGSRSEAPQAPPGASPHP
jgi:hypothetical protein